MGKLTELDDIRKQRKKRRFARQILLLIILLPIAALIYLFRDSIVKSELITNFTTIFSNSNSVTRYPVDLPENEIITMTGFNNDIAVQSRTNLYIYDKRGAQILSTQHNYKNPLIKTGKNRLLMYDQGFNSLSYFSRTKLLKQKTYNYPITVADISKNGSVAVVTGEQQYMSQVIVYNSAFNEQFKWMSSDKVVNAVALSDNGRLAAITCLDVSGGVLQSNVLIFDIGKTNPIATVNIDNSLVLSVQYKQGNTFSIITDNKALLISSAGDILSTYDYQASGISFFDNSQPSSTLIITGDYSQQHKLDFVNLDESYKPKAQKSISKPVEMVKCSNNIVYVLSDKELICYTSALDELHAQPLEDAYLICPAGDAVYYNTSQQIKSEVIPAGTQSSKSVS